MNTTKWTKEMVAAAIQGQLELIDGSPVPMAVVDYGLNWKRLQCSNRFGVRDMNHVKIYNLKVVALNQSAKGK